MKSMKWLVPSVACCQRTALLRSAALLAASLSLAVIFAAPVMAQEDLEKPPEIPPIDAPQRESAPIVQEEEPLPPKVQDEQIEPTVTIREEDGKRVEEYSHNGQVYMVKVTPKVGPPYYYIDTDGDGRLETTPSKDLDPVKPVHWKIKEWD